MSQTLLEKLQLKDERNLLIQGIPSSIEKQFAKLAFAKNLTPLLKIKKIDFALLFAVNETQLKGIISEVLPALHADGKLWVAYPKSTSKIATTLHRDCSWTCLTHTGYENVKEVALDHVWTAIQFKRTSQVAAMNIDAGNGGAAASDHDKRFVNPPDDFLKELKRSKIAAHFFDELSSSHKKEYVTWLAKAKREETRSRRLEAAIDKLIAGKKTPSEV